MMKIQTEASSELFVLVATFAKRKKNPVIFTNSRYNNDNDRNVGSPSTPTQQEKLKLQLLDAISK